MLTLPASVRLFVATEPIDMRKGIDGLRRLAEFVIREDPLSGHIFLFLNRRRNVVKALWWDRTGFFLLMKRLERGTFSVPQRKPPASDSAEVVPKIEIDAAELHLLLEGMEIQEINRRKLFYRSPHKSLAQKNTK